MSIRSGHWGEHGRSRREFCIAFLERKKRSLHRIQSEIFAQVEARGETVTCRRGCSSCCVMYVEASLQECEAITYYLQRHPHKLTLFLSQYGVWRETMRRLGEPFSRCELILHRQGPVKVNRSDQEALLDALRLYQERDLRCSFLCEGACMIHAIRPYVCCNHYVTTPSEWCRSAKWLRSGLSSQTESVHD